MPLIVGKSFMYACCRCSTASVKLRYAFSNASFWDEFGSLIGICYAALSSVSPVSSRANGSGHPVLLECPAAVGYCLSNTSVEAKGLPSAPVPREVCVSTLPSAETTF